MVNTQNEGGDSPLHMACAAGHEAFVRTLLASGAASVKLVVNEREICTLSLDGPTPRAVPAWLSLTSVERF